MGGININQKHNLTINSKSLSFYILASLVLLTLLSFIIISIRISFLNAIGNEGTGDTGTATLNSVSILQAGTGQSVTIKGETLNENDYGTDNATRRTILNNNIVRYNANYNVTKVGQITFSITLPANNTIDEATIAESQGCLPNLSKLESADITNSDGTITKSYTNNKATCVRNITTTGSTNWQITAYLWGANNTKIQPTLAVSGQTSTVRPEEISVVGRGDYGVEIITNAIQPAASGYDFTIYPVIHLYANKTNNEMLGIAPLEDEWSIELDTSDLPDGWIVQSLHSCGRPGPTGGDDGSVINNGTVSYARPSGYDSVILHWSGSITGTRHCPVYNSGNSQLDADKICVYSGATMLVGLPVTSLTIEAKNYTIELSSVDATVAGGGQGDFSGIGSSYTWTVSARAYGNPFVWGSVSFGLNVGWDNSYAMNQPVYVGELSKFGDWIQLNTVPMSADNVATSLNYCTTWNSDHVRIADEFSRDETFRGVILSDYKVQYGIIGTDMSVLPSSSQQYCGKVGDENILGQMVFFDTLEEANQYAKENNLAVNAMRLWSAETRSGIRDGSLGGFYIAPLGDGNVVFNASGTTNEWNERSDGTSSDAPSVSTYTLTPGLLSHTLTAIPSSTNPGKEDHITISTKTYNKDTNTKITTTLPNGLSPKAGSFTITTGYDSTGTPIKEALIEGEGQDYTIASSSDGGYTITFDLDHIATTHHVPLTGYDPIYPGASGVTNIAWNEETSSWQEVITTNNNNTDSDLLNDDLPIAADNDGNGIDHAHTPIEFDLVVNEDAPVPSTLTINSTVTGTGTSYASTSFKTASDTIAIANPPATFGYDLTATPSNIYAGDSLTYNYSISNTTKDSASNITMVSVLPHNGDSRGTTGLKEVAEDVNPYTITSLSLSLPGDGTTSGSDTSTTRLYYTLDPKARDLESADPEALGADPSITWQELDLDSDGTIPSETMTKLEDEGISTSITALKLTTTTLPSGSKLNLEITLDSILATTPGAQAKLASDITYLTYRTESNSINTQNTNTNSNTNNAPTILLSSDNYTVYSNGQTISTHQNPITTNYLGELLALSIPEDEQSISITTKPGTVLIGDPLINHLSLTTGTLHGYTLTMQATTTNGALTNKDQTRIIPTMPTKPTTAQAGWSATIAGSNNPSLNNPDPDNSDTYTAIPGINQTPLNLYTSTAKGRDSRTLTITYALGTAPATMADTYTTEVVYTMTGG